MASIVAECRYAGPPMAENLTFLATFRYNHQVQIPTEIVPKSGLGLYLDICI
jgi:hypothetical protein